MRSVGKKGQEIFGMSFGMIFSIIITIFIIAVAFFAIRHFLGINECAQIGLFYEDLQNEVNRAWSSGTYVQRYYGQSLPGSIKAVCFGKLEGEIDITYSEFYDEFQTIYSSQDANIFFYPTERCSDLSSNTLKHAIAPTFFCREIKNGKFASDITIQFDDLEDDLVKIIS